jgi:hypothetical protein
MNDQFGNSAVGVAKSAVGALVSSNFTGFSGVKVILPAGAVHDFSRFSFAEPLSSSLVSFEFGHKQLT